MKVDRAKAVSAAVGGETDYFCSEDCLRAYQLGAAKSSGTRVDAPRVQQAHSHRNHASSRGA